MKRKAYLTKEVVKFFLDAVDMFDLAGETAPQHFEEIQFLMAVAMYGKPYEGFSTGVRGSDPDCYYCYFGLAEGYFELDSKNRTVLD